MKRLLLAVFVVISASAAFAWRETDQASASQAGKPAFDMTRLAQPPTDSWPTYNGDYSGRRFSPLTKINDKNVGALSLAWMYRPNTGGQGGGAIKGTPLMVNGVLYVTLPDHVWAVDAPHRP